MTKHLKKDHYKLAEQILEKVLQEPVDQAEVYLQSASSFHVDVLNREIESINQVDEVGLAIRVFKNNALGFSFTSDLDGYVVRETIQKAVQNANNNTPDEFNDLPEPAATNPELLKKLNLFDPAIEKISIAEKIELAKEIEKHAYSVSDKIKKTEKVTLANSSGQVIIVNSKGLKVGFEANQLTGMAQMIAVEGDQMEYGFHFQSSCEAKGFSPDKIGIGASQQAIALLGGKPIPSAALPVVLSPEIGAEILSVLCGALKAENVLKHKSLFEGKLDQLVANSKVTLIDDSLMPKAMGSAPFDSEGTPGQQTTVVSAGKLKSYLFNHYSAKKFSKTSGKMRSTGNASRGDYHAIPGIGATNFYLLPGTDVPGKIVGGVKRGIYLMRLMGLHTANPVSGEFSLGAQGILIENGEKTVPVAGITIAGNLKDIIQNIETIGNDLEFYPGGGNFGCPTLLISQLSISGI